MECACALVKGRTSSNEEWSACKEKCPDTSNLQLPFVDTSRFQILLRNIPLLLLSKNNKRNVLTCDIYFCVLNWFPSSCQPVPETHRLLWWLHIFSNSIRLTQNEVSLISTMIKTCYLLFLLFISPFLTYLFFVNWFLEKENLCLQQVT